MTAMEDGAARPSRRPIVVLVAVAALVYAADVISKVIVVATLTENRPVRVIGSLLRLDYLRNPGAAFSLGADGYTVVFTLIAAAVIVAILRIARYPGQPPLGRRLRPAARRRAGQPDRPDRSAAPGRCVAGWSTSSSCRTGRCSTWPTRRSAAAGRSWSCSPCSACARTVRSSAGPAVATPGPVSPGLASPGPVNARGGAEAEATR